MNGSHILGVLANSDSALPSYKQRSGGKYEDERGFFAPCSASLFLSVFLPAEQIRGRWMSGSRADSEGAMEATK